MAMKRCPDCGEKYSATYKYCPFCEEGEILKKGKTGGRSSLVGHFIRRGVYMYTDIQSCRRTCREGDRYA